MKAITLWQPWASLVAIGAKTIETRSWSTPYRGELAIHAAKRNPLFSSLDFHQLVRDVFKKFGIDYNVPLGVIVATCELVDVFPVENFWPMLHDHPLEASFGDWSEKRFGWQLSNIKMLEPPIPARGSQGFWNWKNENPPSH